MTDWDYTYLNKDLPVPTSEFDRLEDQRIDDAVSYVLIFLLALATGIAWLSWAL